MERADQGGDGMKQKLADENETTDQAVTIPVPPGMEPVIVRTKWIKQKKVAKDRS